MSALGGVAFSEDVRLDGVEGAPSMAGSARLTMGGVHVQWMPVAAGAQLSLRASVNGDKVDGFFTRDQVLAFGALRDSGQPVTLTHSLGSWTVWLPPDAIQVELVDDYVDPGDDDWYVGTINMITV